MLIKLIALVCIVLVLFEGRVVYTLFSHKVGVSIASSSASAADSQSNSLSQDSISSSPDASDSAVSEAVSSDSSSPASSASSFSAAGLAGAGSGSGMQQSPETPEQIPAAANPEYIDSPKVVPEQPVPVDDSYFSDAVFIGDSRMEGFRNSSGITQGTFLTGIGLGSSDMNSQIISTADGTISVYQGLSGRQYNKIYLMLGANDLGFYPWENFLPQFENILEQFHQLQPKAIIYVCSVIYVDETKIAPGYEYNNNENVMKINGYILEACEKLWYSYYLNLNEIFSDGYHELITDASSDGIHLYGQYLEMMLSYLKTHYIPEEEFAAEMAKHPDDIANADANADAETEAASSDSEGGNSEGEDSGGSNTSEAGTAETNPEGVVPVN